MTAALNADSNSTRQRIVDAATAVFSRRGYDNSSMRMIAERAEVSVGTITHYFDGKEDLFGAVVDILYTNLSENLIKDLGKVLAERTADEAVEIVVRTSYDFAVTHQLQSRLMIRFIMERGTFPRRFRDDGKMPALPLAASILEATLGVPLENGRIFLHQWAMLLARISVMDDAEACMVTGLEDANASKQQIVDGLLNIVRSTLSCYSDKVSPPQQ